MEKKSAISGEYVISQQEDNSIKVYRIFDNVLASLREAAEGAGFEYDPKWTTRQFGTKLCKQFGDGKNAQVGNYYVKVRNSGAIECYREYDNQTAALREVAGKIGFEIDPKWNTRQFGSKLIDALNK